MNLYSHAAS